MKNKERGRGKGKTGYRNNNFKMTLWHCQVCYCAPSSHHHQHHHQNIWTIYTILRKKENSHEKCSLKTQAVQIHVPLKENKGTEQKASKVSENKRFNVWLSFDNWKLMTLWCVDAITRICWKFYYKRTPTVS